MSDQRIMPVRAWVSVCGVVCVRVLGPCSVREICGVRPFFFFSFFLSENFSLFFKKKQFINHIYILCMLKVVVHLSRGNITGLDRW